MRQAKVIAVMVLVTATGSGCMVLEKGIRATASVGLEGYSEREDRVSVKPDADPVICKAYKFSFCSNVPRPPAKDE